MDPGEYVELGDVEFFKQVGLDVIQNYRDNTYGWSILITSVVYGQLNCAKVILERCPEILYKVDDNGHTPLHAAAVVRGRTYFLEFLLSIAIVRDIEAGGKRDKIVDPKLLMVQGISGQTALHNAVEQGHLGCAKLLLNADNNNNLLRLVDKENDAAMHYAVRMHKLEIVKLLLETDPAFVYAPNKSGQTPHLIALQESFSGDRTAVAIRKLLIQKQPEECNTQIGERGWTLLHHAASNGDIPAIEDILGCAKLLKTVDTSNNFLRLVDKENDAAMHIAVRDQKLGIVKLLLEADPAFVYAPNKSGQTPHLIAMQDSFSGDRTAAAIIQLLIEKQPEGCKTQIGERGWTLLHYAAFNGDIPAIEDILEFSPDCAKLVDSKGQNFFHHAVKLERENVFRHILGSTKVDDNVLNQQDINGDTPLHIATSKGNANVGSRMLYNPRIDKFVLNKLGKNALDAINFEYDKRRAGVYGFLDRVDEKDLKDRSEFDLLVGALIATVSFTVGITVPGGYFSEGSYQGNAVLNKKASFEVFVVSNTIALALSLYAVFSHFCTKHLTDTEDIIYQLQVATFCSLGSMFAMMVAFIAGSYSVLAVSARLAITVCVICCLFFAFAFRAMWRMTSQRRKRRVTLLKKEAS